MIFIGGDCLWVLLVGGFNEIKSVTSAQTFMGDCFFSYQKFKSDI